MQKFAGGSYTTLVTQLATSPAQLAMVQSPLPLSWQTSCYSLCGMANKALPS